MTNPILLQTLGLILVTAAAVALLTRRLGIPSIVAYISAGLILGPFSGVIAVGEDIHLLSEVGIALLLFLVGLELSFAKIRDVGKVAVTAGTVQIAVTAFAGFGLARILGFAPISAIFIGIALTFSSTVVVVKLLEQKRELHALHGRIGVGVLLVQDLAVIVVLTFLAGLGPQVSVSFSVLARGLAFAALGTTVLVAMAVVTARWILPSIFGWIAASAEGLFIWSLCWCFLFVLTAELLHLSPEIGAFLAGVSLAQLPYSHDLRRRVHPLMNFFLAVFFVGLGIQMELGAAAAQLPAAIILSFSVLVGKPVLFIWLLGRAGYSGHTAFRTGITLAQISEFSFIAVAAGVGVGLIDEAILSLVGLVGLITIGVSSYLIQNDQRLTAWGPSARIAAFFGAGGVLEVPPGESVRGHIVVVGMNALGRRLVEELSRRGERVIAIDSDPRKLADLSADAVLGSAEYFSVLEEANLAQAKLLISALQIEDTNNLLAYWARTLGVPASIHAFDRSVVEELREIGVSHLMLSKNTGIKRIAAELRKVGILDS